MQWLLTLSREEDAVTAVEYAVMLALIILVCVGVISTIGRQTSNLMDPGGNLSGAMDMSNR
jgi:pilus assembly protein Flp/PilA